jgi:hypothetical protein
MMHSANKTYRLSSNTQKNVRDRKRTKTCRKQGFPRHKVDGFEGGILSTKEHKGMTHQGYKNGGSLKILSRQTFGLLCKFDGKPYTEFLRVFTAKLGKRIVQILPEFGYGSVEDFVRKNFFGIYPTPDEFRFDIDAEGYIRRVKQG